MKVKNMIFSKKQNYKRYTLFFLFLLVILLIFIFLIIFNKYIFNKNIKEGINYTNNILIKDTSSKSKTPYTVGVFSIDIGTTEQVLKDEMILTNNCPSDTSINILNDYFQDYIKKEEKNSYFVLNDKHDFDLKHIIYDNDVSENLILTISPVITNLNDCSYSGFKYYKDIFPLTFKLDIQFDKTKNWDFTDMSNSDMNIYIENNCLNLTKTGVIYDSENSVLGFVNQDVYDPYHYYIMVNSPIYDLNRIVFNFKKFSS